MKSTTAILSAALLSTGFLASAPSAMAAPVPQAAGQQSGDVAANFTDQQLQDFSSAAVKISEITQTYMPKLQKAGDDIPQRDSLRREANAKMIKAVESSGLKVDEFNRIGQAIQQDPKLLKRVQAMAQPRK